MEYTVEIIEILSKLVEVEAETLDKAYESIREAYKNSDIVLNSEDFTCSEIRVISKY